MASKIKIETNRKNALKSTGPKDTSRTRFNATKHALLSNKFTLENPLYKENFDEFQKFVNQLFVDYEPQTCAQMLLLEEFAKITWKIRRAEIVLNEFILKEMYSEIRFGSSNYFDTEGDELMKLSSSSLRDIQETSQEELNEDTATFIDALAEVKEDFEERDRQHAIRRSLVPKKAMQESFSKYHSALESRFIQYYEKLEQMRSENKRSQNG